MKAAVFSDIHGNKKSLDTIINMIKKESPDKIFFLGDIFQRGNDEIECLERLMQGDIICIKGNCEMYLDKGVDIDDDVLNMREYYDKMRGSLTEKQRSFVHDLPLYYEIRENGQNILLAHFLIKDKNADYPFYPMSALDSLTDIAYTDSFEKYDLIVVGHTHRNFRSNNIVGIASSGIAAPTALIIETGKDISFSFISQ